MHIYRNIGSKVSFPIQVESTPLQSVSNMNQDSQASLGSLVSAIDTEIAAASKEIEDLTRLTKELVPQDVYESLTKETPVSGDTNTVDEDALVQQQEHCRLQLIMQLQKQDFISTRLQEMVFDSEQLVQTVVDHCSCREDYLKTDEDTAQERRRIYRETLDTCHVKTLDANIEDSAQALAELKEMASKALQNIADLNDIIVSEKFTDALDQMIVSLNRSLNRLLGS